MEVIGMANGAVYGPLAVDPICEETKAGNLFITLVVRTDSGYTDREGTFNSRPQMVAVKFFGGEAQRVGKYNLGIGDLVAITVSLGGREYNGKYYCDVVGEEFRMMDRATAHEHIGVGADMPKVDMPDMPKAVRTDLDPDEDLPF